MAQGFLKGTDAVKSKLESLIAVTVSVSPSTKYTELQEHLMRDSRITELMTQNRVLLLGLHSCGDLTPTMLRLYADPHSDISALVVLGCCYNLLTESGDQTDGSSLCGYPMSTVGRDIGLHLGWRAKCLAAVSPERWSTYDKDVQQQLQVDSYRSVLSVILRKYFNLPHQDAHIGNIGPPRLIQRFSDLVHICLGRLGLQTPLEDDLLDQMYADLMPRLEPFLAFDSLRAVLAPLVETFILLDRIMYLCLDMHLNARLMPVFDPAISPRSIAIVAWELEGRRR
mmetsp:Transcript_21131/g.34954  ORF Transcript_21131/g.34954 Transcript_21131/m.34954 type:complete len:283 (-) Transcript_21131:134-982(-)